MGKKAISIPVKIIRSEFSEVVEDMPESFNLNLK
jgi:hypothetical protein